jgi:hypothetical protein
MNLKVNGNLSYVNAKSQEEEEEGRTLLYNIDINTCMYLYTYIYIFTQKVAFERLMLHINEKTMMMIKEYSSFEIGIQEKCRGTKITIYK